MFTQNGQISMKILILKVIKYIIQEKMIQQVQHLKLNKRGNAAEDRSDINTTGNESK